MVFWLFAQNFTCDYAESGVVNKANDLNTMRRGYSAPRSRTPGFIATQVRPQRSRPIEFRRSVLVRHNCPESKR